MMEGVITNYKRSRHTQTTNQAIVEVGSVSSKAKASELVGKKVTWTSPAGKDLKGEVRSAHGNSGALRVLFERGVPGQAIGKKVKVE
jgi:large subunit ribosomal protein L35Ae